MATTAPGSKLWATFTPLTVANSPLVTGWLNTDGFNNVVLAYLFTSGTTAAPKCAVLRHANLLSYVLGTVEFGAAEETDCTLSSVPPYHIAGPAVRLLPKISWTVTACGRIPQARAMNGMAEASAADTKTIRSAISPRAISAPDAVRATDRMRPLSVTSTSAL